MPKKKKTAKPLKPNFSSARKRLRLQEIKHYQARLCIKRKTISNKVLNTLKISANNPIRKKIKNEMERHSTEITNQKLRLAVDRNYAYDEMKKVTALNMQHSENIGKILGNKELTKNFFEVFTQYEKLFDRS